MAILKFCHVKKGDRVIVLTGDFKRKVGIVTKVVRALDKKERFLVALDCLPKRRMKKKKSNEFVEKDLLIDSSNVLLLKIDNSQNSAGC